MTHRCAAFARSATVLAAVLCSVPAFAAPLKVACTGTSAMQGLGSSAGHHVPDELGRALGPGFDVGNFGAQGTTAIASIASSYAATSQMKAALAFNPNVVLFWFGGNDSFQGTWDAHKSEFKADYTSLIRTFQALPTHPKTLLVRLWTFVDGPVQRTVLDQEILPLIDQIAVDTGSELIDYRKAFENHPEYFPDGMHPNDTGTVQIGKLFADAVTSALAETAGSGGATSLGGAGGTSSLGGAGGARSGGSDAAGVSGAANTAGAAGVPGSSGSANAPTAGAMGNGGAAVGSGAGSGGGSAVSSGASSVPAAGTPTAAAPLTAGASNGGGCSMSASPGARTSALWFLLAGLGLARRRRRSGKVHVIQVHVAGGEFDTHDVK
ncbi:MAG TPA: GDSL-type esterase/lipase family protein [Polyangiaceae bacterium]|nr:GDSL-type esterase/lipase family protein [Polyangiaceae bacterium]